MWICEYACLNLEFVVIVVLKATLALSIIVETKQRYRAYLLDKTAEDNHP